MEAAFWLVFTAAGRSKTNTQKQLRWSLHTKGEEGKGQGFVLVAVTRRNFWTTQGYVMAEVRGWIEMGAS